MEEKTLLEYLYSLDEERTLAIYILINERYELITVNYARELSWCLSLKLLTTRYYSCAQSTDGDLEYTDIYIQELA